MSERPDRSSALPTHPDRTDEPTPGTEHSADWPAIALVVVLATLLAGIVVLHLTGVVGPGAHP